MTDTPLPHVSHDHPMQNNDTFFQHLPTEMSRKSWYPKMTPYRVVVIATTIGLGTAKAVVTQKGAALISTTLEWIGGTLLTLIFFFLSAYDSRESVPSSLKWFFQPDCMDLVWQFLALFSIKRPGYISDEVPSNSTVYFMSSNPDITSYRLLVCATVTAFGMAKAILSYSNQLTAVTWSDWAISVPVSTLLFYLGLYEYNSLNILHGFFSTDQSAVFYSANRAIMYILGMFGALLWSAGWAWLLYQLSTDPHWKIESLPEDRSAVIFRDHIAYWQAWFMKRLLQEALAVFVGGGPLMFFLLSKPAARWLRGIWRLILRTFRFLLPRKLINTVWKVTNPLFSVALHLSFFLPCIIFMLTFWMVSVLSFIDAIFQYSWKEVSLYVVVAVYTHFSFMFPFLAYKIGEVMIGTWPTLGTT